MIEIIKKSPMKFTVIRFHEDKICPELLGFLEINKIAKRDGFKKGLELLQWFDKKYKLPYNIGKRFAVYQFKWLK